LATSFGLGELLQFRIVVEGAAHLLAAHARTTAQLAAMEASIEEMRRVIGSDPAAFSRADIAFHDLITVASGNKLLQICGQVVRSVVVDLIARNIAHSHDSMDTMRDIIDRHRLVVDAIRDRDGTRAARLIREHIFDYYADYVDLSEHVALDLLVEKPG